MKHTTTLRLLGTVIVVVLVLVVVVLHLSGAENLIQSTTELVLILVSVVGTIAVQLMVWPERFLKPTDTSGVAPETVKEIAKVEAKTDVLKPWRQQQIMKLGFQSLVKQDLLAIERQLVFQTPKRIDFESWNDTDAETKKRYVDKETVYRTIDNIAKVLNEWNTELDRASLLMLEPNSVLWLYIQSCKKYYEKLRAIEFLS